VSCFISLTFKAETGKFEEESAGSDKKKLILLDARNLYETRIGKFDAPDVKTLDPEIRQYSDLTSWIDNNTEQLRGNNILINMQTDIRNCYELVENSVPTFSFNWEWHLGIALEELDVRWHQLILDLKVPVLRMFFSYMVEFKDIWNNFQMEAFSEERILSLTIGIVMRTSLEFQKLFLCYVLQHTVGFHARFVLLVSVGSSDSNVLGTCLLCGAPFDDYTSRCRCTHCRMLVLICDSCREKKSTYICELCRKNSEPAASISSMDDVSEEVLQPVSCGDSFNTDQGSKGQHTAVTKSIRKLRILCLHGFRQNASSFKGRTASLAKKLKNIAELVFVDAPHELPFIYQPPPTDQSHSCKSALSEQCPPFNHCNRKFAWLVAPDYDGTHDAEWKIAKVPFDSLQYQQQTEGFEKSIKYLKTVFSEAGPFDGILGFSQGAAMAALVGAHREKLKGEMDFRFVVLCSGFAVNMTEYAEGSINCPSLHIFGCKEGKDRQIEGEASRQLASLFQNGSSVIIEHDLGHIIPTRSPYIDEIKDFLRQFL
ncbi:Rhodanese-like domain-containing protein 6, partial [Sesamum angolense]